MSPSRSITWLPRFSLWQLLLVVGFVAVGFAALRHPAEWVHSTVMSLTIACLCLSIVLAIYSPRLARPYWGGFAVCSIGVVLLTNFYIQPVSFLTDHCDRWLIKIMHPQLAYPLIDEIIDPFATSPPVEDDPFGAPLRSSDVRLNADVDAVEYFSEDFYGITKCLWTFLLGCIGGWVALVADRRARSAAADVGQ